MSEENKPELDFEEFISERDGEYVRIPVQSKRSEAVGFVLFSPLDGKRLREFQKLNSGNGNIKKRSPLKANNYLIDNCFVGVEGIKLPFAERGYSDEKMFLKYDPRGQVFADIVLGTYLSSQFPDTAELND